MFIRKEFESLLKSQSLQYTNLPSPSLSDPTCIYRFSHFLHLSPSLPRISLEFYTCGNHLWTVGSVEQYFKVPKDLKKQWAEYCNKVTGRKTGLGLVGEGSVFRLSASQLVPSTHSSETVIKFAQFVAQQSQAYLYEFLSWAQQNDCLYRHHYMSSVQECRLSGQIAPSVFIPPHNASHFSYCRDRLQTAGCTDLKVVESCGWLQISCKANQDLAVKVDIGPAFFSLDAYILSEGEIRRFDQPGDAELLKQLMPRLNDGLSIGQFCYHASSQCVRFRYKSSYITVPSSEWGALLMTAFTECVNAYNRAFDCTMDSASSSGSVDYGSEENAESLSDSHESFETSATPADLPYREKCTVDPVQAEELRKLLPSEALACFYLGEETGSQLVLWTAEVRLSRDETIGSVCRVFERLGNLGILINPLPLDCCLIDQNGETTIAASFPLSFLRSMDRHYNTAEFRATVVYHLMSHLIDMISTEKAFIASVETCVLVKSPFLISVQQLTYSDFENQSRFLGNGGFGSVYQNKLGNEQVAVKVLPYTESTRDRVFARVMKELQLMVACPSRSIVQAYGYCETSGRFLLVMEYCRGGTLSRMLKLQMTKETKVAIIKQLAEGIALLHAKNICHFDIKPSNILFHNDTLKLCDFGLSHYITPNRQAKRVGLTIRFASPEQLEGRPCGRPADVWSFGLTAFAILQGRQPFKVALPKCLSSQSRKRIMHSKILRDWENLPFSADFRRKESRLCGLIESCLKINTTERPTMRTILESLAYLP